VGRTREKIWRAFSGFSLSLGGEFTWKKDLAPASPPGVQSVTYRNVHLRDGIYLSLSSS
jgi:hypothetical protein